MSNTPECRTERSPTPDADLRKFDWSLIRTHPSFVRHRKRKPALAIQLHCTAKLRTIREHFGVPSGLSSLVESTRILMTKSWKAFHLYHSYEEYPASTKWSLVEWRKWDLVEFFTKICSLYWDEVVKAENEGVELVTKDLDEEFLSLLEVLLKLEQNEEGVVMIEECERPGTKTTLECEALVATDVTRDDSNAQDSEDEEEAFDGQEMTGALPKVGSPPRAFEGDKWIMEMPMRGAIQ